jgi:hypothetical protein
VFRLKSCWPVSFGVFGRAGVSAIAAGFGAAVLDLRSSGFG